jgi:hypothetical protein
VLAIAFQALVIYFFEEHIFASRMAMKSALSTVHDIASFSSMWMDFFENDLILWLPSDFIQEFV